MDILSYKLGKTRGGGGGGGVTHEELIEALATKQDTLIEGTNIKIENSIISSNQPTAKNPEALTFGDETYDGSTAKEITASKIGAATEDFVNSSIATNTAYFKGTFNSLAELEAISETEEVSNNDYGFVKGTDAAGNTTYTRYKYNAEDEEWIEEYVLNNSSFTAEQWATIQSGITSADKTQIATNTSAIADIVANMPDSPDDVKAQPKSLIIEASFDGESITITDSRYIEDGAVNYLQLYTDSMTSFNSHTDVVLRVSFGAIVVDLKCNCFSGIELIFEGHNVAAVIIVTMNSSSVDLVTIYNIEPAESLESAEDGDLTTAKAQKDYFQKKIDSPEDVNAQPANLYIHGETVYDEETEEEKIVVTDTKYLNEDETLNVELLFADISATTSPLKEVYFVLNAGTILKLPLSYFINDGSGDSRALFEAISNNTNIQIEIALSGEITLSANSIIFPEVEDEITESESGEYNLSSIKAQRDYFQKKIDDSNMLPYSYISGAPTIPVRDYTLVVDEVNGNHFINDDDDTIPVIDVFSELLEYVLERNNTNVFINVVYPDPDEGGYTPVVTKVPYVLIDAEGDGFVFSAKYRNVEVAISITGEKVTVEIIEKEDYKAGEGIDITDYEISSSYGTYQPAFRVPLIEKNEEGKNYKRYTTYNGSDYLNFMLPDGAKIYMFGRKNPYVLDETLGTELNEDQKAQLHEIWGQTFLTGMYVPFNVGASLTTVLNNIISDSDDVFSPIDDEQPVLIFIIAMAEDTKFRFLYLTDRSINTSEFKIESLTKKEIYKIPEKALNLGEVSESNKGLVTGKKVYKAIAPDRFELAIDVETSQVSLPTIAKYGKTYSNVSDLFNDIAALIDHNKQVIAVGRIALGDAGDYGYFEFPMLASYYNSANEHTEVLFNQIIGNACYELQIYNDKIELEIRAFAEE